MQVGRARGPPPRRRTRSRRGSRSSDVLDKVIAAVEEPVDPAAYPPPVPRVPRDDDDDDGKCDPGGEITGLIRALDRLSIEPSEQPVGGVAVGLDVTWRLRYAAVPAVPAGAGDGMMQVQSVGGGIAALRKALGAYKGIPPQQIRATTRGVKAMKTLAAKQVRALDPVQGDPNKAAVAEHSKGADASRRATRSRRSISGARMRKAQQPRTRAARLSPSGGRRRAA